MNQHLGSYRALLLDHPTWKWKGRVIESVGQTIESLGPVASIGECCRVVDQLGGMHEAEVIGFRGSHVISMPLEGTAGIRLGDSLEALGAFPEVHAGPALIGRVLDGSGLPIDKREAPVTCVSLPLNGHVRLPLEREPIRLPLATGIRAIDGFLCVGRGQRIGIFGGSGVGKSTLIGMMTRNTEADITIVGLVGERGREVREFLEHSLGERGLARSVVVVSTSDSSALMRMRAALAAVTLAEYYASEGKHVLLVLDSLTRFAMAAREVGLAAGEPPTAKGYTPSVFTRLAKLLERAGNFQCGSITGFYTVLMEGDDQQDPLVDTVRSLLDGHIVLSRGQAAEGWYPPIAVLDSVSRLMPAVTHPAHQRHVELLRRLMAIHSRSEDLIRIGAYKPGSDPDLDRALRSHDAIRSFLVQGADEYVPARECFARLEQLAKEV